MLLDRRIGFECSDRDFMNAEPPEKANFCSVVFNQVNKIIDHDDSMWTMIEYMYL